MGAIRSIPNSQITLQANKFEDLNYVQASVCGWQHLMEDYTGYAEINPKLSVFYVIDGHGGPDLAELAHSAIPQILRNTEAISTQQYKSALQYLFQTLQVSLKTKTKEASTIRQKYGLPPVVDKHPNSGLSMVIALVGQHEITIANIGECKSYVCYKSNPSKAVLIAGNHTQGNQEDQSRVKNAGGFFLNGKVNGMFPYTRTIGDYAFKKNEALQKNQQLLIATPSIFTLRKEDMKTIVLGSGGLWENPALVLKQITEDDLELGDLKLKTGQLLRDLVCSNPKEGQQGLKNMSIIVIDLKN